MPFFGVRAAPVKALYQSRACTLNEEDGADLALVEIHREDIPTLPQLLHFKRGCRRCLLFCDDLSFEVEDTTFKSLKAVLEGGIEGRPENIISMQHQTVDI